MDIDHLRQLLNEVQSGRLGVDQALDALRLLPYEDLGFARLDVHRALRCGFAEVVFCQGKTPQQVTEIIERLWKHHARILGTRATPEVAAALQARLPEARYDPTSRLVTLTRRPASYPPAGQGYVAVISAGTADLPAAEEAAQTLEFLGQRVERAYDVGVAGLHRLLDQVGLLMHAAVVISVAGMDGALTSVVSGLVACPVIGVPTSVGYGASFEGLAALLTMLNACGPGVVVVNIDNGFGAGLAAHRMLGGTPPPDGEALPPT
ncbi:MAG: nickel pincer cofactor biosynthesis protein LarB [Anaerolineales bacterium]|nr:nickel pincer cofactor biosynthesis protein LarB [Anaerolineales bacterium]